MCCSCSSTHRMRPYSWHCGGRWQLWSACFVSQERAAGCRPMVRPRGLVVARAGRLCWHQQEVRNALLSGVQLSSERTPVQHRASNRHETQHPTTLPKSTCGLLPISRARARANTAPHRYPAIRGRISTSPRNHVSVLAARFVVRGAGQVWCLRSVRDQRPVSMCCVQATPFIKDQGPGSRC